MVAVRSALSYRLPLDNAYSIIDCNDAVRDGVIDTGNSIVIIMAGTGFVPAKGVVCGVEWLIVWDNRYEVVTVVLHVSAFLDTWGSHVHKWQQRTQ